MLQSLQHWLRIPRVTLCRSFVRLQARYSFYPNPSDICNFQHPARIRPPTVRPAVRHCFEIDTTCRLRAASSFGNGNLTKITEKKKKTSIRGNPTASRCTLQSSGHLAPKPPTKIEAAPARQSFLILLPLMQTTKAVPKSCCSYWKPCGGHPRSSNNELKSKLGKNSAGQKGLGSCLESPSTVGSPPLHRSSASPSARK